MSDIDFNESVCHVEGLIRGWIGNIIRNYEGENAYVAEAVFSQALRNILHDLDEWNAERLDDFIEDTLNDEG